jgi:hypothetical protein
MENFKVKEVSAEEEKSVQEVEEQLLANAEAEFKGEETKNENISDDGSLKIDLRSKATEEDQTTEANTEEVAEQEEPLEDIEDEVKDGPMSDEVVLNYLKEKYNLDLSSLEQVNKKEELPSDVEAFLKYKRETGRGMEDYLALNQDFSKMSETDLLRSYIKSENPEYDAEDIDFEIEAFAYDEDVDDAKDIKRAKLEKKKTIAKARKYFEEQKGKYLTKVESTSTTVDPEVLRAAEEYKRLSLESENAQSENMKRHSSFKQKTEEFFSNKFEGFKYKVGDSEFVYKPGDVDKVKNRQLDVNNFFSKFLDNDGYLTDAAEYHKAIATAMNPDAIAKFFYEKGKSEAVENLSKESKNVKMDVRQTSQASSNFSGFRVSAVDSNSGNRLRIKKR